MVCNVRARVLSADVKSFKGREGDDVIFSRILISHINERGFQDLLALSGPASAADDAKPFIDGEEHTIAFDLIPQRGRDGRPKFRFLAVR